MKRLNIFDKILFFINSIVAALLIFTYLIPYINPEQLSSIAILSLAYPGLLILNIAFILIWLIKLKPQIVLSIIVIAFGFNHTKAFFAFQNKESFSASNHQLKLLTFNVRQFNLYSWIKSKTVKQDICNFIDQQNPDIVCFQEYKNTKNVKLNLPYKYVKNSRSSAMAIYSKYKIINSGSLNFINSHNNSIYIDVEIHKQKVRVYNVHLQSFSLDTQKENFGKGDKKQLFKIFKHVFKKQALQIKSLKEHISASPYPTILSGDFNNTAFSWNYKQLVEHHKDAFVAAGNGFGRSYKHILPFRIDFIFPEKNMKVNTFTTFKKNLSDHNPIMATISLNN